MPNKIDKAKAPEAAQAPAPVVAPFTLLFQLEDVVVNGRKAAFAALKKLFAEQKLELTPALFGKYAVSSTPQVCVPEMLETAGGKKTAADKLIEAANESIATHLSGAAAPLPALTKVLAAAKERQISMGAITALPDGTAESILAKSGLTEMGVSLFVHKDVNRPFPGPDIWLKTAKAMNQRARKCSVIAGNGLSCKSALSADMRCVVVTDEFTSFQDFSGANLVLEKLEDASAKEILEALFLDLK